MLNKVYNSADEMNRSEMQGRFLEMLICSPPFLKGFNYKPYFLLHLDPFTY